MVRQQRVTGGVFSDTSNRVNWGECCTTNEERSKSNLPKAPRMFDYFQAKIEQFFLLTCILVVSSFIAKGIIISE